MSAYLNVVFDPTVPIAERERLLRQFSDSFMPDDSEIGAYVVDVPKEKQLELAQEIAELQYNDRPAVARVSYTRPLRELQPAPGESTSH